MFGTGENHVVGALALIGAYVVARKSANLLHRGIVRIKK